VCKSKVGSAISATAQDLGPGLSPVVRARSEKPSGATRLKTFSSKLVVAKSEFTSCTEAAVTFKVLMCFISLLFSNPSVAQANPKYVYTVIACTAEPGEESSFSLTCFAKRRLKLKSLNAEASDMEVVGQWHDESAGGCVNHPTWRNNPQYFL
jgi:hypothetical protein